MREKGLLALETDLMVMSFVHVGNKKEKGGSGNDYNLCFETFSWRILQGKGSGLLNVHRFVSRERGLSWS